MSAQTVESEPQHGTLAAYTWHYRNGVPMDDECRAASSRYQSEQASRGKSGESAPTAPTAPTERVPTPDGRVISWREVCCPRHRGAW